MGLTRRTLLGTVAGTLALGGCFEDGTDDTGGTDGGTDQTDSPTASPTEGMDAGAVVQVRSQSDLGEILVGPEEMTLYMFDNDEGGESTCYDQCAEAWPPLTVDDEADATAGADVAAELGTTERDDGSLQVTAAGHPLYYFASDEEPGDASGQGVNDVWFVLRPDGSVVRSAGSPTGTPTPSPTDTGGGGGGY